VRDAKSELEILKRLAVWSSTRWDAGHLGEAYPAWDALEILKTHPDGRPIGGFCQQYNVLFLQACESFGFVGRAVSLNAGEHSAKIRSGHEVVEIWSNEYGKWIYIDGNTAWCALDEATRVPLSLWELRQRQLQTFSGQPASPVEIVRFSDNRHAWPGLASFPPFVELRLIPRSNFLAERSPLPLNQGMRGCFWTGHYAWTDAQAPAALLYGNRVHRRADWEWTLNQAHIVLEPTDRPGELRVHIDTVTPGFETFLADIDGQGPERVASGRVWKLRPGTNRLEARSRNIAGRDGSASWIVVEHVP
jgi:hypothetical protein